MAYTTPATFADNDILTAAALNTLSTAITELQSVGELPTAVWLQRVATSSAGTTFYAKMRHAHRYLWWSVRFGAIGQGDDMTLTIYPESGGSHVLFDDSSPEDLSYALVEDLDGLLDDGEFYRIAMYIKVNSGGQGTWLYCEERSVAS
jgi:hypothetical protein